MDIFKKIRQVAAYHCFWLVLLFFSILFTFWELPQTFYQQDEWLGLGQIIEQGWSHITYGLTPLQVIFGDGRPLTRVLGVLFFNAFPLDGVAHSLYSLFFHFGNTVLVYFIAIRILKEKPLAFISALFFAVNSVSHQAVTWFGASFGTQPATCTTLLSILLFLQFLEKKQNKFAYSAFFLAVLSLYFKESGMFLFLFLPLLPFLFQTKVSLKKYIILYLPLISFIGIFVLFRFLEMTVLSSYEGTSFAGRNFLQGGKEMLAHTLFIRSLLYPLTSLSLIFIPPTYARELGFYIQKFYYPYIDQKPDLIALTAAMDLAAIVLSFILLFVFYNLHKKANQEKRIISFSLIFFVLSVLPYIVIEKQYAYMEPRYYYVPSVAAGILLAYLYNKIVLQTKKKLVRFATIFGLILLFILHIRLVQNDISIQKTIASERLSYISQLKEIVPTLHDNTNIFLVTGDKPWLVEGNRTPFQHGFGYSVALLYKDTDKVPHGLLSNGKLFNLGEEGYWNESGMRFGYYWDEEKVSTLLERKNISVDKVIKLYYNSKEKKLYRQSFQ